MRLEELINAHKEFLNPTDLTIWKYIFNHRKQAGQMSVHELAKACAVSSATLVRFAKKIGLRGYSELRAAINFEKSAPLKQKSNALAGLKNFYAQTVENLLKRDYGNANKLLYGAKRIFAFSSGYVQDNVVQEMKRIFLEHKILVYQIVGIGELDSIIDSLTEDDLFIFVSLSGESPVVLKFAERLKIKGVPSISITQLSDNTLASLSTANLYISPARFQIYGENDDGAQFFTLIPFFILIEIWYLKYRIYAEEEKNKS